MGTIDDFMKTHSLEGVEPAVGEQQKILLGKVNPNTPPEQPMFIPKINKNKAQAKVDSKLIRDPGQKAAGESSNK